MNNSERKNQNVSCRDHLVLLLIRYNNGVLLKQFVWWNLVHQCGLNCYNWSGGYVTLLHFLAGEFRLLPRRVKTNTVHKMWKFTHLGLHK